MCRTAQQHSYSRQQAKIGEIKQKQGSEDGYKRVNKAYQLILKDLSNKFAEEKARGGNP